MDINVMEAAAKSAKTPFYVFDTDELRKRVCAIRAMLKGTAGVCYAMKANPFLVKSLEGCVDKFEICSPGEYYIYEGLVMPGDAMVYSGVYKDEETFCRALEHYHETGIFTIESQRHLEILNSWAAAHGKQVKVYLRLTSGNQFGMDEDTVRQMVRDRADYPQVRIEGIHYFSGTQKRKMEKMQKELLYLDHFCMDLRKELQFQVKVLEYGPGAAISYFKNDKQVPSTVEMVDSMKRMIESLQFGGQVTLELGRFLAAMCGYYFVSACDIKVNKGESYCIVDGGIHQMNYDGQLKGMYLPYMKHLRKTETGFQEIDKIKVPDLNRDGTESKTVGLSGDEDRSKTENRSGSRSGIMDGDGAGDVQEKWNICGALCTVNDVICRQVSMGSVEIGDVFVFERTGAYSVTEGMLHFLSRNLPEVYFYSAKEGLKSVRKPLATYTMNRPQ